MGCVVKVRFALPVNNWTFVQFSGCGCLAMIDARSLNPECGFHRSGTSNRSSDTVVVRELDGYYDFDAKNRPDGWNAWVTLAIPVGSGGK
jgi:hypothetical protein